MEKLTLVDCLKLFNRKERYWLLRNALGNDEMLTLPIAKHFIEKIWDIFGFQDTKTPNNVWWAMDYHFDWIAGAMRLYGTTHSFLSPSITTPDSRNIHNSTDGQGCQLITGTQEDVDLILAFEETVILIEAKGVTSWSKEQFERKEKRRKILEKFASTCGLQHLELKMLLMSPKESEELKKTKQGDDIKNMPPHLGLLMPGDDIVPSNICDEWKKRFLKPTRCTENKNEDAKGDFWKIDQTF